MPKIDLATVPLKTGSIYPEPYASMMAGRSSPRLGQAGGLTQFGVNIVILQPGAVSSLRHWQTQTDATVRRAISLTASTRTTGPHEKTLRHDSRADVARVLQPPAHRGVGIVDGRCRSRGRCSIYVACDACRHRDSRCSVDFG